MTEPNDKQEPESTLEFSGTRCPLPLRDYPNIILGHGGGGKLSGELVEHIFLPAFENDLLAGLADSVVFDVAKGRLAFSTDSYVVQPLFFPGGSIGDLAVNGTVNDLSMSGARPVHLSAGFIIEEGFPVSQLKKIADDMGAAARAAGVSIITGDTKVVERGHGDGCYVNTAGIGIVPEGINIAPHQARPGDAVIVSGTLGDHGMAVMSVREGLEFEAKIETDSAPLNRMVAEIIGVCPDIHVLRDPTRGGLAASLNEISSASKCGIEIEERSFRLHRRCNPLVKSSDLTLYWLPMKASWFASSPANPPTVFWRPSRQTHWVPRLPSSAQLSLNIQGWSLPKPPSERRGSSRFLLANNCPGFAKQTRIFKRWLRTRS